MTATRRAFLESVSAGAAMFAGFPVSAVDPLREFVAPSLRPQGESWDLSWITRVTGTYKAVFDVAELESGYGVWRASVVLNQYRDVLKAGPGDFSMVLVLRHNGIALAMRQAFWSEYRVGKAKSAKHPLTGEATDRNPALLSVADGVAERYAGLALDKFLARGGIALACNLALDDCIELVKKKDRVSDEAARKKVVDALVPGVILQPSGVFAAVRAQQAGCVYVRAS